MTYDVPEIILEVVENDTQPWVVTVFDENGGKPTFSGDTITLRMWGPHPYTTEVIDDGAVTVDSSGDNTTFSYSPVAADVDEPGTYYARYKIVHSNAKTERWPRHPNGFQVTIYEAYEEESS